MASIVSCPGCQKRLNIGADRPGGKLRCPACNTPFVLGARTNEGAGGTPEYQAFELFEDNVVTDVIDIEEEAPPTVQPRLKSTSSSAPKQPAPQPTTKNTQAADTSPLPPIKKMEPEKVPDFAAPPQTPIRPSSSAPVEYKLESVVQRQEVPRSASVPGEFFLPRHFDPFASASPRRTGVLDFPVGTATGNIDVPALIEQDFIAEAPSPRITADGVAVVEAATEDEIARLGMRPAVRPPGHLQDRTPGRETRRGQARKQRVHGNVRPRWAIVFWGLTIEIVALALLVLAVLMSILSIALTFLARDALWLGLLAGGSIILLAFREIIVMLGYALCIAAPARNNAWIWALLALLFAFGSMFGNIFALIFPPAFLLLPLTLISWFFFLIYLKSIANALKIHYLAEEAMNLMKLLGLTFMGAMIVWFGMLIFVLVLGPPKSAADVTGMGLILGTCTLVFGLISIILAAAMTFKYWYILMNLREEIGWRLEA